MVAQNGYILVAPRAYVPNEVRPNPDLEEGRYFDTGCELSPSCLSCTLPVCKEDDPTIARRLNRESFDRKVYAAWIAHDGLPKTARVIATATDSGVQERTVWRVLARRT